MLNAEIMDRYGLTKDWRTAGFYETKNHRQIARAVRAGLGSGRLIAITGPIGIGKTVFLHRLQDEIAKEKKVTVAESLSVDKARTTVPTLIAALFYDLSREKEPKIPTQGERRERELQKLVVRSGKPVALFVDEAHARSTRQNLKRIEAADGGHRSRRWSSVGRARRPSETQKRSSPTDHGGDRPQNRHSPL